MTNQEIKSRLIKTYLILTICAFLAGLITGLLSRKGVISTEQAETAITATAEAAIDSKNSGRDDRASKISAEMIGARTLSTEKTTIVYKDEE